MKDIKPITEHLKLVTWLVFCCIKEYNRYRRSKK